VDFSPRRTRVEKLDTKSAIAVLSCEHPGRWAAPFTPVRAEFDDPVATSIRFNQQSNSTTIDSESFMTTSENFHARPPLGLPTGSIRALLTLLILGIVVHEVALGRPVAMIWNETLVIALAYYFTYRRFVSLPADAISRLEADGTLPREQNPLFLPRLSIRFLILLVIGGLLGYLYREGRLFEPQVVAIFGTLLCYLLGVLIRGFGTWWMGGQKSSITHLWEDVKAVSVVLAVASTACLYFLTGPEMVPHWLETTTVGLVLFYFGSR
jgi:hypothetical protein